MKGESCRSLMLVKFLMPLERSQRNSKVSSGLQKSVCSAISVSIALYITQREYWIYEGKLFYVKNLMMMNMYNLFPSVEQVAKDHFFRVGISEAGLCLMGRYQNITNFVEFDAGSHMEKEGALEGPLDSLPAEGGFGTVPVHPHGVAHVKSISSIGARACWLLQLLLPDRSFL